MNWLRGLTWLVLACCAGQALAAPSSLPLAESFAHSERGVTLVIYSRDDCPYCDIVKRDHLVPLLTDARYRHRVDIREVRQDANSPLIDFSGKPSTHAQFARDHGVGFVPVVALFNHRGEPLAEPIVGLRLRDFYQAYLEEALNQALAQTR